jgi:hypothetical protein
MMLINIISIVSHTAELPVKLVRAQSVQKHKALQCFLSQSLFLLPEMQEQV